MGVVAYDVELADRVRLVLGTEAGSGERPMFGGLAFLLDGAIAVAASGGGGLMVRVDPAEGPQLVAATAAEPMVMRGRQMAGWLRLTSAAVDDDDALRTWVERGVAAARAAGR